MHHPYSPRSRNHEEWQAKTDLKLQTLQRVIERIARMPISAGIVSDVDPATPEVALIVKGFLSSSASSEMEKVAEAFEAAAIPQIYFNYCGRAQPEYSPADTTSSPIGDYCDVLMEYFDFYPRTTRFHLVAHSLGGLICLKLLYDHRWDEDFW